MSAKGRKDGLQIVCKQKNIPIVEEELDKVFEGWEGKLNGMLQALSIQQKDERNTTIPTPTYHFAFDSSSFS